METMINFGSGIKSLEDGKITGQLVIFSSEKDPDLAGDFFTKDTDFGIEDGAKTPVWFHHRKALKTADGVKSIIVKEKIGEGTLTKNDDGIFIEAILYNRKQYENALSAMGWSSGTAAHLVEREKKGKANQVKQWPLGLDASITPIPCEPRTAVSTKSLDEDTEFKSDFIIEENEIRAVVKSSIKASGSDIFEQNLTEQNATFWRLESALMETAKDIANAAASSSITGATVDVLSLVSEAVGKFGLRATAMIVTQISEWLESENRENFYLKSTFLDALISSDSPVKQKFEDRLDTVLAAVERVATDAKEIHEMRKAQKAGRKISASRMTKLKELMTNLQDLIADAEGAPMTEEADGKTIDPSVINSLVAEFENQKMLYRSIAS